jgi:DNA-directed RNA polymerase subunit beta
MAVTTSGTRASAVGSRQVRSNLGINRVSFSRIPTVLEMPNLIELQLRSFEWFKTEGMRELLEEISPIIDYNGKLELHFLKHWFEPPRYSVEICRERDMTYAAPLYFRVRLVIRDTGEVKESDVYVDDFPMMTETGTFVINGAERVVVSQLVRSPGAYFELVDDPATGRQLCTAKLIPSRGAWLEFETSNRDALFVKVDRKRKLPVTVLLRAVGYGRDEELYELFADVDTDPDHRYIAATIERDKTKSVEEAQMELYRNLRPGDPPTRENAASLIDRLFFNPRTYDLAKVGRYKLNKRLGVDVDPATRVLTPADLVALVKTMIKVNRGLDHPDDIDHLGNRRVRTVGELIQMHLRTGLQRLERGIRERMTIQDIETVTPNGLISSTRPVRAAIREFFGGSQLSQFMDQTNPLAELTHKRRLSALGPGGLNRERAGFDVRDVHDSHYGRICPIETPEGPNIGLIGSLATYARVNEYGFITTPYRRVYRVLELPKQAGLLLGQITRLDVTDPATGEVIVPSGTVVDEEVRQRLLDAGVSQVPIVPFVSDEIEYLTADQEEHFTIAQANTPLDEGMRFAETRIEARRAGQFVLESPERIDFMDVSPKQIVSVAASLIPFLEHNDVNRALMGANMQRQAVPLVRPEAPLIGTGVEHRAVVDTGDVVLAEEDGEVVLATSERIVVKPDASPSKLKEYRLAKYERTNQGTCYNQRPYVKKGDRVKAGDVLADGPSSDGGELALGRNLLVAFMPWEGYNYEDAIIISERVVQEDLLTSIHIEEYEVEARETKLGDEEITREIPVRIRGRAQESRRGRYRSHRRLRAARRHPRRQGHTTWRERADAGRKTPPRDLRRESTRRARHVSQGSSRRRREGHRRSRFSRENGDELNPGVLKLVRVYCPGAKDLRGRQACGSPREQRRHFKDCPCRGHAVPRGRNARGHHSQSARRAVSYEYRADSRNPPGMGGPRGFGAA